MAGKIIADIIEAPYDSIRMNVGNTTVLTANGSGITYTPTSNLNISLNASANISTGNIIASGVIIPNNGIRFPASQVASGDANTLDDYEEGTWTPIYVPQTNSFTSITYDPVFQRGFYTKIGRMVVLIGAMRTDALTVGSATGNVYVGGFPFTVGLGPSAGPVRTALAGFTNFPRILTPIANTTTGELSYKSTANGVDAFVQVSDLGTGANQNYLYAFQITYFTA